MMDVYSSIEISNIYFPPSIYFLLTNITSCSLNEHIYYNISNISLYFFVFKLNSIYKDENKLQIQFQFFSMNELIISVTNYHWRSTLFCYNIEKFSIDLKK